LRPSPSNYGSEFLSDDGPYHLPCYTPFDHSLDHSLGKSFGESFTVRRSGTNIADTRYQPDNSNTSAGYIGPIRFMV